MPAEKTISVSYRVTPEFKEMLELAAAREKRSRTNLLEWLLSEYCRGTGLAQDPATEARPKSPAAKKPSPRSRK